MLTLLNNPKRAKERYLEAPFKERKGPTVIKCMDCGIETTSHTKGRCKKHHSLKVSKERIIKRNQYTFI